MNLAVVIIFFPLKLNQNGLTSVLAAICYFQDLTTKFITICCYEVGDCAGIVIREGFFPPQR